MKLGLLLHEERGCDAVLEEARLADSQGYDSVWLFDHLMGIRGEHKPDVPLDSFTLMTAVGAVTSRVRLAWSMLNPSFRYPAVLAKMLATLDQITHGRVICTIGAGWFKEEYEAYGLPLVDDHDARIGHEREVIQLLKLAWTKPAPERVSFEGRYVQVRNLPFNPAPFQKPHPPIWIGGDSEPTLELVRELADGWVMLRSGNPETLGKVLSTSNWPKRPMTLMKNVRLFVDESHDAAVAQAKSEFERSGLEGTFEDFLAREVAGTPTECAARLREIESWGINYVRTNFGSLEQQAAVARLLLPLID